MKPIRAVVCSDGCTCDMCLYFVRSKTKTRDIPTGGHFHCGPHRVIELVEKPKGSRKRPALKKRRK